MAHTLLWPILVWSSKAHLPATHAVSPSFQVMGWSAPLKQREQCWSRFAVTPLLGAHGVLHSCVFDPSTHLQVHAIVHACAKCTLIHSLTHADLHLLPLCATSVHLIDDAMSLHTLMQTHICPLPLCFPFLYVVLHCTLSFISLPCRHSTVAGSVSVYVCVCVRPCLRLE